LPTWSVEKAQDAIDKCYNQLFSPKALQDAAKDAFAEESSKPKQHNLMMQLHNCQLATESETT
jgi:hypothetical protein